MRGVSLAGIRAIEAGERPNLNYAEIVRLARALGVELGCFRTRGKPGRRVMARETGSLGLDGLDDRKMAADAPKMA